MLFFFFLEIKEQVNHPKNTMNEPWCWQHHANMNSYKPILAQNWQVFVKHMKMLAAVSL